MHRDRYMIYDNEIFKQSHVCISTIGIPSAEDGQLEIEADVTILLHQLEWNSIHRNIHI